MRHLVFTSVLLVCSCLSGFSQSKSLEKADRLFKETSYPAAIEAYKKAIKDNPKSTRAVARLADCYRLTNDHRNAFRWYAKAAKSKKADPEVWFHFGEELMMNRKYEQAIPWLEKYQAKNPSDDRIPEMIASCKNLEEYAASKSMFLLRRLKINSEASDFGPTFYKDQVVFASARKRSIVKANRTGEAFLDFYTADYNGKPELGEPRLFRGNTNTPFHEANACFSADGKEIFFTRNNVLASKKSDKDAVVQLALYRSEWIDGKWQNEAPLPFNSDQYSSGHPALSPDGKKLYYVSRRPGGFGGTDLWVVERKGKAWGKPENLGQDINSKGNEMFPWMAPDGMLYFASNGQGGLGGLDIFKVDPVTDLVSKPVNMGAPINSPYDDFSMILDPKTGIGFFTSNRLGGKGEDDLYALMKLLPYEAEVVDEDGKPIEGAAIDMRLGRSRTQMLSDGDGKFLIGLKPNASYLLLIKTPGYQDFRLDFVAKEELTKAPQQLRLLKAEPSE